MNSRLRVAINLVQPQLMIMALCATMKILQKLNDIQKKHKYANQARQYNTYSIGVDQELKSHEIQVQEVYDSMIGL